MTAPAAPSVEVVYIAFRDYGAASLDRFLRSYEQWPAACPHVLTVALKGFDDAAEQARIAERCRRIGASTLVVPDAGLDVGTYFHVAARIRADILCLLNSNAEILGDAWLGKLVGALRSQGGGAVSATGSWESLVDNQWGLRPVHPVRLLRWLLRLSRFAWHFPRFPNPHLRTNALVIRRADLLRFGPVRPTSKEEAWRFESGRAGLSAGLRRRGLPLAIVGRDGRVFNVCEWNSSGTFWQGEQANLLIADNQTQRYALADLAAREALERNAWSRPSAVHRDRRR